jgi:hypothetical protein
VYEVHGITRRASLFNTDRIGQLHQDPHEEERRLVLHHGDLPDAAVLRRVVERAVFSRSIPPGSTRGGSRRTTASRLWTGEAEVPLTLAYVPESAEGVLADEPLVRALDHFFTSYAGFAEREGVTPWLVYMPVKLRAMHGQLRFTDRGRHDFGWWTPTDLPELIGDYASRHGIGFIDVTPALVAEMARARETLYYTIYDTHLSPGDSRVVGEEIARQLSIRATDLRARD